MAVTTERRHAAAGGGDAAAGSRGPLGILAAAGPLPIEVAEAAERQGRAVHIVAIDGFAGPDVARFPHERASLGQVGRILGSFARAGVRDLVIAGAMQRPDLLRLKVDWGFFANLPTVLSLTKGGDDSVLRHVVRFFEGHGLTVIGAGEVASNLLAPTGPLGKKEPDDGQCRALARGASLIGALGRFDVGQAVVVTADQVVAVEGVRGTDAMLRDLGPGGIGEGRGRGAVLVKLAKPGQELRIDLPTIGAETVRRAKAAGLAGIGVGAGAAIVLERAALVAEADAAGLFVTGIEPLAGADSVAAQAGSALSGGGSAVGLSIDARRAPTPADRADIAIGRRLAAVLRDHRAGRVAIVSREHVTAISGDLPPAAFVAAQGRPASWGRRAFRKRIGVLVASGGDVPGSDAGADEDARLLDADLFRAVMAAGLAGVVWLGAPVVDAHRRGELAAWADEAGVFLMGTGAATSAAGGR